MHRTGVTKLAAAAAVTVLSLAGLAACGDDSGGDDTSSGDGGGGGDLTPVTLQLQWVTQAQFAGYIEALAQGYYEDQGLDVQIVPAGTDTVPQLTVDDGGSADYAIAWTPKALQSREQGANITNVGQVFQRSGTLQISFKDAGITSVDDLEGKNVGSWGYGNEFELYAAMTQAGLDPAKDVKVVQQAFDMNGFLNGDIDAAQAMTYNEYAQVLEAENPETGELYTPDDLNVLNWNDEGTAMLQDAIWANTTALEDPEFQETTVKFLTASYQGWIACADDPEQCRDDVVAAGSQLGASHQLWQTNEVNKLIWPSPDGIGMMDEDAWNQTIEVALNTQNGDGDTVITEEPDAEAYTTEYTEQALANLEDMDLDTKGEDFEPIEVTLEEGGK